jgi:hypothetical protein
MPTSDPSLGVPKSQLRENLTSQAKATLTLLLNMQCVSGLASYKSSVLVSFFSRLASLERDKKSGEVEKGQSPRQKVGHGGGGGLVSLGEKNPGAK